MAVARERVGSSRGGGEDGSTLAGCSPLPTGGTAPTGAGRQCGREAASMPHCGNTNTSRTAPLRNVKHGTRNKLAAGKDAADGPHHNRREAGTRQKIRLAAVPVKPDPPRVRIKE